MVPIADDWRRTGHFDRSRAKRRAPLRMRGGSLVILTGGAPGILGCSDAWRPSGGPHPRARTAVPRRASGRRSG
jgi:hypothetical protein